MLAKVEYYKLLKIIKAFQNIVGFRIFVRNINSKYEYGCLGYAYTRDDNKYVDFSEKFWSKHSNSFKF